MAGLGPAFLGAGENHVSDAQTRLALGKGQESSSRPDLDVVRMRTDRQHRQRLFVRQRESEWQHGPDQPPDGAEDDGDTWRSAPVSSVASKVGIDRPERS